MGNRKKQASGQYSNDVVFCDLALQSTQEADLKRNKFSETNWLPLINAILAEGYKITLKTDARTSAIMALVQDTVYNPDDDTVIYVMRSASAPGVLLKLAYYWVLSRGTFPDANAKLNDPDSDDDLFA